MQSTNNQDVSLPNTLQKQLLTFFNTQAQLCSGRGSDAASQAQILTNFAWATALATRHYQSRIIRATDLQSAQVIHAQELAREYIGYSNHDFFATCVDGRNMPTIMFSKPPHVGGVLRAPAGTVNGFLPGQGKHAVFIDHSTFVVHRTTQLLKEKSGGTIFYGLDSHISCAARGQIHETEGGLQQDGGIRSDVINKMMTARGILQLRAELMTAGEAVAEVIPTFFSFDPNTGGVWFGLEACVDLPQVVEHGFTQEILSSLIASGQVISSRELLTDPFVQVELSAKLQESTADFRHAYPTALENNWMAISSLYARGQGELFTFLHNRMVQLYQHAGWLIGEKDAFDQHSISERTITQKTKFLLKNLVTRFSIAGTKETWPFDHHQEEMVVITDGGYAPFPATDAFAVFSRDLNALVTNTKLTIDLIRGSRRGKKLENPFPKFQFDQAAFVAAPVLISNKSIVKGLTETEWETISSVDLNVVLSNLNWDDDAILNWQKPQVSELILSAVSNKHISLDMGGVLRFVDATYELFQRMQVFMKDKHFRHMMFSGNIIILNTIVDENRYPRMIMQLVV